MQNKTNNTSIFGSRFPLSFVLAVFMVFSSLFTFASGGEGEHEEKFKPGEMIMHHIADAHQIHIIGSIYIPLPVILYHEGHLEVFSSSNFWNGFDAHGELQFKPYTSSTGITYENHHETIIVAHAHEAAAHEEAHVEAPAAHEAPAQHGFVSQEAIATADSTNTHEATAEEAHAATEEVHHITPMDFSITKTVFGIFLVVILMLVIFLNVAKAYKKAPGKAPRGLQNLMEIFIMFIRDEVAVPSIGKKKADKFVPFLLTVFFFIWIANMLGLIPFIGGFNVTGTISVTIVLATLVFLITSFNGNAHYWGHIVWPPGVPLGIKLILVPIEIMSIFIKPAVLMIRLTANINAGHIIILAFTSLVIIFGEKSAVAGYSVGVFSTLFMIFMFFIELLVAFLQAYVFTLLAALYFGDATQEHHHEEAHH